MLNNLESLLTFSSCLRKQVTFHMGFGGNSSIGSIATLCNQLKKEIKSHNESSLSPSTLERLFESYQTKRHARMKMVMYFSLFSTRTLTWDTPLNYWPDGFSHGSPNDI